MTLIISGAQLFPS